MASSNFETIPIIDLRKVSAADTKEAVLKDFRTSLTDIGFLYVSNHGVSDMVIRDLVAALPLLFALPAEAKSEVALAKSPYFLGYSATGTETTVGRAYKRE
jgi:isopenicillin N synthase-like dioxygenase